MFDERQIISNGDDEEYMTIMIKAEQIKMVPIKVVAYQPAKCLCPNPPANLPPPAPPGPSLPHPASLD